MNPLVILSMCWCLVMFLHWVGDFVLQNDEMAINKSKSNKWLFYHCAVYTIVMLVFGWKFALINGISHFCIDWTTSRINSKLWANNDRHNFFVMIGFDQFLHMSILFCTFMAKINGTI